MRVKVTAKDHMHDDVDLVGDEEVMEGEGTEEGNAIGNIERVSKVRAARCRCSRDCVRRCLHECRSSV